MFAVGVFKVLPVNNMTMEDNGHAVSVFADRRRAIKENQVAGITYRAKDDTEEVRAVNAVAKLGAEAAKFNEEVITDIKGTRVAILLLQRIAANITVMHPNIQLKEMTKCFRWDDSIFLMAIPSKTTFSEASTKSWAW